MIVVQSVNNRDTGGNSGNDGNNGNNVNCSNLYGV